MTGINHQNWFAGREEVICTYEVPCFLSIYIPPGIVRKLVAGEGEQRQSTNFVRESDYLLPN
jgi:hypothetical protein